MTYSAETPVFSGEQPVTNLESKEVYDWLQEMVRTGEVDPDIEAARAYQQKIRDNIADSEILGSAPSAELFLAEIDERIDARRREGLDEFNQALETMEVHVVVSNEADTDPINAELRQVLHADGSLQFVTGGGVVDRSRVVSIDVPQELEEGVE